MREMKDSGTLWLRSIPTSWTLSRIGSLYSVRNEKVSDKDFAPLSVTMRGIVPQLATAAKSDDGDNRKLVRKGDFAINSRSDRRGSCGISDYTGSVSLINTVLTPRKNMHPGYYNWLFHTTEFADEFYRYGHGIVDDLWTTRWQEMKSILVPVPDINEQSRIAAYLDRRCATIDALIANQQQQIDKLKQYKQAVITEAVTRGLDPSEEVFFDSVRLKFITTHIIDCPHETPEYSFDGSYYVIRTADQDYASLRSDDNMYRLSDSEYQNRIRRMSLDANDIVYGREGERWGLASIVPTSGKYCLGQRMMQIRCDEEKVLPKYCMYALSSIQTRQQGELDTIGSTSPHVNISTIRNFALRIPSIERQTQITNFLDNKCAQIDALIALKQQKADKLAQYKKSLIYEVVTGKREV